MAEQIAAQLAQILEWMKNEANPPENAKVDEFKGTSFDIWKFKLLNLLDIYNLEKYVEEEAPADLTQEWKQKDSLCKRILLNSLDRRHSEMVMESTSAKAMLAKLEQRYKKTGVADQMVLRDQLSALKYTMGEDLESHFVKFDSVVRQLGNLSIRMKTTENVWHLIRTLPTGFSVIIQIIKSMKEEELDVDNVKKRILDYHRDLCRKEVAEEPTAAEVKSFYSGVKGRGNYKSVSKNSTGKGFDTSAPETKSNVFKCFKCKKPGHKAANC